MAIGADMTLAAPKKPSPAPMRREASRPSAGMPPMIADSAVQDVVSNTLASSAGSGALAMKEMDRAGVSRGRGQQYRADLAQAESDATARAGAVKAEMGAASANANARNAYDVMMQGERLSNAGLLEGLRNNTAMEQIAQQGRTQDMYEARRRGQLGLDSIYLDYSPLLQGLFS